MSDLANRLRGRYATRLLGCLVPAISLEAADRIEELGVIMDKERSLPENIGRYIECVGHYWKIIGINYTGDYQVARFENREDGRYQLMISCRLGLSKDHNHYARLLPPISLTE